MCGSTHAPCQAGTFAFHRLALYHVLRSLHFIRSMNNHRTANKTGHKKTSKFTEIPSDSQSTVTTAFLVFPHRTLNQTDTPWCTFHILFWTKTEFEFGSKSWQCATVLTMPNFSVWARVLNCADWSSVCGPWANRPPDVSSHNSVWWHLGNLQKHGKFIGAGS